MYQLTSTETVIRISDGAAIPNDPGNRDRIEYDAWLAGGGVPIPYVAPIPEQTVLPQDLMAQFTSLDAATIQTAISGSSSFLLLWYSMLAQKDPMLVANARFQTGWAALVQVLGAARMAAIATALGITP